MQNIKQKKLLQINSINLVTQYELVFYRICITMYEYMSMMLEKLGSLYMYCIL